ncbi:hypothetical protein R3P38DRAFT_3223772 [Favolaschia claudopus]|uniref:Uncharacterized protein n=1 Tax=Favolaschia claudopus TaxID=2862362 RepID=A0AAV9ZW82_9AGAR
MGVHDFSLPHFYWEDEGLAAGLNIPLLRTNDITTFVAQWNDDEFGNEILHIMRRTLHKHTELAQMTTEGIFRFQQSIGWLSWDDCGIWEIHVDNMGGNGYGAAPRLGIYQGDDKVLHFNRLGTGNDQECLGQMTTSVAGAEKIEFKGIPAEGTESELLACCVFAAVFNLLPCPPGTQSAIGRSTPNI